MPDVRAGQIWKLLHPHNKTPRTLTTFTILRIESGYAVVQGTNSVRRIRLDGFGRKAYYQLLREAR